MDVLMQAQHKASEALYKNQAEQAGGAGAAGQAGGADTNDGNASSGNKPEGDVIDAEVVEDEKK